MKKKNRKIVCLSDKHCGGHLSIKHIDYSLEVKGRTVSVPEVEVWECDRCGERFYPYQASKKIDLYKEYSGRLMLRLDPELHWRLTRIAKKHHRSLNQEVNYLLESTLKSA